MLPATTTTPAEDQAVPLVDLQAQHAEVAQAVAAGFERVLSRTAFVLGDDVTTFERRFAAYTGAAHCVGVGNGTDAIELALRAVGVQAGDEVIVPANTFVATAEAVIRAGARPVAVDCDEDSLLVDVDLVLDRVGPRTRAVVPVHLYGQMADTLRLVSELGGRGVAVVEDAAQAQGASQQGRGAGAVGDAAATSFYPGKNLGAYGDAGAVLTGDEAVADRLRRLRNHGGVERYEHEVLGTNSRLDTLQAVVLNAKLDHLDRWNQARREAARRYDRLLEQLPVRRPFTVDGNVHVWHLYVIRLAQRDRVLARLHEAGIGAGIHYPTPIHQLPALRGHVEPGRFANAEAAAGEILSLPLYPHITPDQQERVVAALATALREVGA